MKNNFLFTLVLFAFLLSNSCFKQKPSDLPLRLVLSKYFDAVNANKYYDMSSYLYYYDEILSQFGEVGTTKVAFTETIDKINSSYEEERESGTISFDKFGIIAVRILGLGRGLYYTTENFSIEKESGYLELLHSFNYDEMDYSIFPQGTVLYFLGCPLGKIYKTITGVPIDEERHYLAKIKTKWYFKKDSNNKWKITKMEILKDSIKCQYSYKKLY